jgi:plasmid stabilization system protein ParE
MSGRKSRKLFKHEQAKQDLVNIYAYLSERSELAAQQFLDEARKTFDVISKMPGIGHRWKSSIPSLPEILVAPVSRR